MKQFIKYLISITFLFSTFALGSFFYLFDYDWVDFCKLQNYDPGKPSIVLDTDNNILFRFQLDKREPVNYNNVPDILIKAFVAAEDWNFFSHYGISFRGIIRSLLINLYHGRIVQGASTITQQVAKIMFLSHERTIIRKIKDVFLAFQLERQFTKEQIMELYLNNVYFGRGIYGIKAASQRFWNKPIEQINLAQAATLAGTAKSAFLYSPLNAPLSSQRRRNLVLNNMYKLGFITKQELNNAINTKLKVTDTIPGDPILLYIQEWIRAWAEKNWGKDSLYKKGLKIKTTIDPKKQKLASKIFRTKLEETRKKSNDRLNGGLISIESNTGKIRALIGGYDFNESQYNRALQAKRQIGSSFKPFLYASALKTEVDMDYLMVDEPIEMEIGGTVWKPKNWTNRFEGQMTLLRALTLSNNIIAVKLLLHLGYEHVIKWARKFMIKSELKPYPSLALGTAEMTVKDLAASFNIFANNGNYIKPYLIEWVKDSWDKKIWKVKTKKKKVLDTITNSKMINALSYRIKRAKRIFKYRYWIDAQAIGKSGSTNEATSTWFVGSTPELTTCVYIGNDDNAPLGKHVFASSTVFPLWLNYNIDLHFDKKVFYIDPKLKEVFIDWKTGKQTKKIEKISTVKILKEI
ncbi:PBP1A family penicillin-binding protein [Candidatus Dependentiae bacterium]|nr:PBP1A family penicillin-binding protein [Candidatus Dependentiae bacterium]